MGAGNDREFIDFLQEKESLEKLRVASEKRIVALGGLIEACIQLGAYKGAFKYFLSPEFEEDAREYCAETGWVRVE